MKIQFCGAARTVTGSCYLLEANGRKFLVDCGLFQGREEELNNAFFPFNPSELDFIIVTHAHIDHSGRIPLLIKMGFTGTIYCTSATADLLQIMLIDSGHIHEAEAEWENKKRMRQGKPLIEPLYTIRDAELAANYIQELSYNVPEHIDEHIELNFKDAGHLLGSSIVELTITSHQGSKRLVFTGDLGNTAIPVLKDYEYIHSADYLVMESTYGNRYHDIPRGTNELADIIIDTTQRGGNVIIPSFAVGRTQELLYILHQYINQDKIKQLLNIDFYVDSPLAKEATKVFEEHIECYDEEALKVLARDHMPFNFPNLHFISTPAESAGLNEKHGIVIISSSGMCDAGRIKHHLKHNLWNSNNTVLFVGYQAETTLGRRILYGEKNVKILGEDIVVKAKIHNLQWLSGHADLGGLLDWFTHIGSEEENEKKKGIREKVFIVHGEYESSEHLSHEIQKISKAECIIPKMNEIYML